MIRPEAIPRGLQNKRIQKGGGGGVGRGLDVMVDDRWKEVGGKGGEADIGYSRLTGCGCCFLSMRNARGRSDEVVRSSLSAA